MNSLDTVRRAGLDVEPLDTSETKPLTPGSGEPRSAFAVVGPHQVHSLRRQLRSLRRGGRKYVTAPARGRREQPPRGPLISEPGPVDFRQYGVVARMWMEQVRCGRGVACTGVGRVIPGYTHSRHFGTERPQ